MTRPHRRRGADRASAHSRPGAEPGDHSSADPVRADASKLAQVNLREYAVRFAFGAAIAMLAGGVALRFGARAGGIFLAFPAILPASLTLIEEKEDTERAVADIKGAALGSVGLLVFALVVHFGTERLGVLALPAGAACWWLVALALYLLVRRNRFFIRA